MASGSQIFVPGVNFGPLRVNFKHLGLNFCLLRVNFELLEVDFWIVEGEFGLWLVVLNRHFSATEVRTPTI